MANEVVIISKHRILHCIKISEALLIAIVANPAIGFEGNYRDFDSKFIVMFGFIFAFLMGLASPSHTNTNSHDTTGTNPAYSTFDTGGENGQLSPPKKN